MKKSILILMATFNGQKYLREQLDSIMKQVGVEVHLLVRDDGSQDDTLDILNEFNLIYHNITILKAPVNGRHGPMSNYYELIKVAKETYSKKYDYFAFSDQDDIWKKNKLVTLLSFFKDESKPELVYADYSVIDANGEVTLKSANDSMGLSIRNPVEVLLTNSYAWGHSILFNKELLIEIAINNTVVESNFPHDVYFAKFAALCDGIYFCPEQLVNYRRYSTNVSGMWYKLSLTTIFKRVNLIKESKIYANVVNSTLMVINENKKCKFINNDLISLYFSIIDTVGIKTVLSLKKNSICRKQRSRDINMKLIYSLGIYKKWIGKNKKMVDL